MGREAVTRTARFLVDLLTVVVAATEAARPAGLPPAPPRGPYGPLVYGQGQGATADSPACTRCGEDHAASLYTGRGSPCGAHLMRLVIERGLDELRTPAGRREAAGEWGFSAAYIREAALVLAYQPRHARSIARHEYPLCQAYAAVAQLRREGIGPPPGRFDGNDPRLAEPPAVRKRRMVT